MLWCLETPMCDTTLITKEWEKTSIGRNDNTIRFNFVIYLALIYTKFAGMVKGEATLIHAKWRLLPILFTWCICIWACHSLTPHLLIFPTTIMQSINMLLLRWSFFFTLCARIANCGTKDGYITSNWGPKRLCGNWVR